MSEHFKSTTTSSFAGEDRFRHWSPASQAYAPADVLLNYIRQGWQLDNRAAVETFFYAGYRRVDVFYFTLRDGDVMVEMPVLANPAVSRLIEQNKLTVLRINSIREDMD
ncbi:MAG: hypothetical protein ABI947_19470 [Chloroflexota bacterium]